MDITEKIANKIREKRIKAGISQSSLADKAGVSCRTILNIEKGLPCSTTTLQSILNILKIKITLE